MKTTPRRFRISRPCADIAFPVVVTMLALCSPCAPAGVARSSNQAATGQVNSAECAGDCNQDGQVTIDEIVRIVGIILGTSPLASCPLLAEPPAIQDVIRAVNAALAGCAQPPTPTPSPSPTETPIIRLTPFVFELGEGSQIVYSAPPSPPMAEPLSGRMTLVFREYVPQFLNYDVTTLEFHSSSFTVEPQSPANAGDSRVALSCPSLATVTLQVLINRVPLALSGYGEVDTCPPDLSTIKSFEVCNPIGDPRFCGAIRAGTLAGYSITVVPILQ